MSGAARAVKEAKEGADLPRGKKAEATRGSILAAARKCIGTSGFAEASVSRIAAEAGVSKGVVYYYFRSKDDIALEVLESTYRDLLRTLREAADQSPDAATGLRDMLDAFAGFLFDNSEVARFLLTELWRGERAWSVSVDQHAGQVAELIEEQLRRGMEEGVVAQGLDVRFTAIAIMGTVLAAAQYYLNLSQEGQEARQEFTRHLLAYIGPALGRG